MSDKKSVIMDVPATGRLTCPKCQNNNKNMLREAEDSSHIVNDYPRLYGRKYQCGRCGTWFRRIEENK